MTDAPVAADDDVLPPLAELEPEGGDDGSRRTVPALWIAIGLVLGVGLAALLLQARGGDEPTAQERFAAIPAAVEEAESFGYEITAETSAGTFSTSFGIEGAVDVASKRSTATMDLLGSKVDLISDGSSLYLQLPEDARAGNGGKPWVKVPADGLLGGAPGGLSPAASPLESFQQLAAAGATIEDLGGEKVRGTDTTHYRTTLDLSSSVPAAGGLGDQLKAVPVEVWLDDEGRPRRYVVDMAVAVPQAGGQSAKVKTTIESFDYGKPVDIEVPPADQVAEGSASSLGSLFLPRD